MMQWLEELDRKLLLAINGTHCAFADEFFWIVSGKLTDRKSTRLNSSH